MHTIYEEADIYILRHESTIPWVKIFTRHPYRELTDCPPDLRQRLYRVCEKVEETMRAYYRPDKINIASFGNQLPRVHIHVMARFENDSHFPEPMWGRKLRESKIVLPDFETFEKLLAERLGSGT